MNKWEERLHGGKVYDPNGGDIVAEQMKCLELLYDYNHTRPSEGEKRTQLLKEMFAEIGKDCYVEPPFHANWGGHFVHFGVQPGNVSPKDASGRGWRLPEGAAGKQYDG